MIKKILLGLLALVISGWLITVLALKFERHEYVKITPQQQQAAEAYLAGKLTEVPDNWQWNTFNPEPGVDLRTGFIDAANAKGTVVVVPGFTGSIEMIMREITQLNAAGYRVAAIEYRGQGESWRPLRHPEKGYVESYSQLGSDVAKFARQIRLTGKPLFFFSISKGAHITMRMAAEQNPDVAAYALIVPMIKINTGEADHDSVGKFAKGLSAIGLGSMYAPGQSGWPNNGELDFGVATDCNANPATAQSQSAMFALRPKLRTRGTTVQWIAETYESTNFLMDPANTSNIIAPVRVFTAGIDTLVSTDAANQFCSSLKRCKTTHFEGARHCITRENFALYDGIIRASITHFDQHL